MPTLSEQLKAARDAQAEKRSALLSFVEKAKSNQWNESEDRSAMDAAKSALEAADAEVRRITELAEIETRAAGWVSDNTAGNSAVTVNVVSAQNMGDRPEDKARQFRIIEAVNEAAYGKRGLTGLAAEMDQEGKREARSTGLDQAGSGSITLPSFLVPQEYRRERRDITATTTTTGGHTIQPELQGLIPFLDPRLTVLDMGATFMGGLQGNLDFPRNDASATAVWASAENTTSTETTPTFDKLSMSPKRITAFTDVSKQNLLQTSIAMENFVRNRLNRAVMNLLETACISGTGSSGQPTGLLTVSGTNDITIGTNGGPLTWALVVQFETETATDNADMGSLGYLFTPGVAGVLKTAKRDVAGNGFIWEGPNSNATVNGYRAMATNFLPSTLTKGTSSGVCHAAIFGNWSELMIGQWGGVDLLVNPYTKGKEALVELIINAWYDLGVRHPVSFCKCDEITLS